MISDQLPPGDHAVADQLGAAAAVAARAPSIHNTQPWRWRIHASTADLYLDASRQLHVTDPDCRLATVSCGAALHHAQVALAAAGSATEVRLLPQPDNPLHLATITAIARARPVPDAQRLRQAIEVRHTDRRPPKQQPIPTDVMPLLQATAATHLSGLQPLDRDKVLELAAAITQAQADETADPATRRELDTWTGTDRHSGAGIPDANILTGPTSTTVPNRDFGHIGTLPVNDQHDDAATYAILYGYADDPRAWLRAGQALSDIWLATTAMNIALLPFSAAVEPPRTRELVNRLLIGIGYAQLAIRLAIPDPTQGDAPRTPRLPTTETIERVQP
ncbi:Acg family FMN-binding oxidoreductase [Catellatospora bangladeshensis]|uniref:NAD(P)H nitroreductase n=1 Tax=Catellatospora bangladeshensis TaxID=310355 RepID=A0A8J3NL22_9ACTN|nr:nitroreductase [Catellatospora bangladeshensis]GIF84597.1 NAD(P)H nitroreductase [Catellatospora bangladeshensis]